MTDKDLCRFYSPRWLGQFLAEALPDKIPTRVVDLGSGAGSLSRAVQRRWASASITTVDIDPIAVPFPGIVAAERNHMVSDVLSEEFTDWSNTNQEAFSLAVSNPPYLRVQRSPHLATTLERLGLSQSLRSGKTITADLVFLARALQLVKCGGTIAFIVPDLLISSETMATARALLLEQHRIERVIQLPRRTFEATDAQAFCMVLRKGGSSTKVLLSLAGSDGKIKANCEIDSQRAANRMDFSFHALGKLGSDKVSLQSLGATVTRGKSNSRAVSLSKGGIFHTSNFPTEKGDAVVLSGREEPQASERHWARQGDILMARVDRRLEHKVAIVSSGSSEISDCVFRLRVPPADQARVLAGLISDEGTQQLLASSRGTGAKHISMSSVLNLRV